MRLAFICLVALTLAACSKNSADLAKGPVPAFWARFEENAHNIDAVRAQRNAALVKEFVVKLKSIDSRLAWEIGTHAGGNTHELTISAEGDKSLFPLVKEVVAAAPKIEGWRFHALRQPKPAPGPITHEGTTVDPQAIRFDHRVQGQFVALRLFIPDYKEGDDARGASLLLLDSLIGEYLVETKLRSIDFLNAVEAPPTARPLVELPTTSPFREEIAAGRTVPL